MHNHQMKKGYGNGGLIPRILSVARIRGWADPKSGWTGRRREQTGKKEMNKEREEEANKQTHKQRGKQKNDITGG